MLELFCEFFFTAICFLIGWPVVKLLTLGKYPQKGAWSADRLSAQWTSAMGLAVLVIAIMAALGQFVFN